MNGTADYTAKEISYDEKGCASFRLFHHGEDLGMITLHVPGIHNVSNALAALATSLELGIDADTAARGLSMFHGTNRRFQ